MENKRQNMFKTGLFIFGGLAILVVAIFLLGRNQSLFGNSFRLNAYFKSVDGLMVGNNVRFSGLTVGTVEEIALISDTVVLVGLRMQENVHDFVKKDAAAQIVSDGLMGDKLITIIPGSPDSARIENGSTIGSLKPFDINDVIEPLRATARNAEAITADIAVISNSISKGKGTIGRLFMDQKMADDISQSMRNVNDATNGLSENMEALKDNFLFRGYYKKKEKEERKKQKEEEKLKRKQEKMIADSLEKIEQQKPQQEQK